MAAKMLRLDAFSGCQGLRFAGCGLDAADPREPNTPLIKEYTLNDDKYNKALLFEVCS